jgi:hypothetical protein
MLLIVPKSYPARVREEMAYGASIIYQFSAYSIIDWVAHAQILNV